MTTVAVAIPAQDESELVTACLRSVLRALRSAAAAGVVTRAVVAVSAHRCTDDTAEKAQAALAGTPAWCRGLVVEDPRPGPVGAVRHRLVTRAAELIDDADDAWLFSTDADSRVPSDWVRGMLAAGHEADAVAGLVDLMPREATVAARAAYARILEQGYTRDGHRHVYAANLAVRLRAYDLVGGFPASPHGEEHGLVAALVSAGRQVATPLRPRVQTSGRAPGRAVDGLGSLLARLEVGHTGPSDAA